MATITLPRPSIAATEADKEPTWPLYAVIIASLFIVTGLIWDISWHRTIGRDTFWSPPHVLEQLAAIISGLTCGWVVLHTTFKGTEAQRARSVRFWGFHGPLGAFICIWGTLMMISSAPFDNWWHNAYGLDVRILSPPHMVLAWGMIAIQVGAIVTALARQNRAGADRALGVLYVTAGAMILTMHATVLIEEAAFANDMHSARFYIVTALFFPMVLIALARPASLRWPATTAAAIYLVIELCIMWALQLTPAQARLAPIFNPVTHMVPQPFPLLLVVPALAIDLMLQRLRINDWLLAPIIGASYVALMVAVHWLLGDFLISPAARNIIFGSGKMDYNIRPGPWQYEFWNLDLDASGQWSAALFFRRLAIAVVVATLSARVGLWFGNGMRRIQR